jgi:hypothetical protein
MELSEPEAALRRQTPSPTGDGFMQKSRYSLGTTEREKSALFVS